MTTSFWRPAAPGDEADIAPRDAELIGQQAEQRLVRGALDRRCGDPDPEHSVDHALDMVGYSTRGESDGEARLVLGQGSLQHGAHQHAQDHEDDEAGEVEHARWPA